MTYDNIGSYIARNTRKTLVLWTLFFLFNVCLFIFYSYENKKVNFMKEQIFNFSEINAEATTILYYNTQRKTPAEVDYNKTMLNSWLNNYSTKFKKNIKTAPPELELLENLGKEFYSANSKKSTNQIQSYQEFSDQLELLKRLSNKFINDSYLKILTYIMLPTSGGLFLILLIFTILLSNSLKKIIIHKNSLILEDIWNELQSIDADLDDNNSTIPDDFTICQNTTNTLIEETKMLSLQTTVIKESLVICANKLQNMQMITAHSDDPDTKEKITYIQKLLSRLFTRAERAAALAKASSDNGFQAGILALNVSIEAARAGNSGKPFLAISDRVKDFAEKSSHIGDAIVEELKDADLSIRKAYAVGKNLLEIIPNLNIEQNSKSVLNTELIELHEAIKSFEHLFNLATHIQNISIELEERILHCIQNSKGQIASPRTLEFMKDLMIRSFEKLYHLNYGTNPPLEKLNNSKDPTLEFLEKFDKIP